MATTDNDNLEPTPMNEAADPTGDLLADIEAAIADDQPADTEAQTTDEPATGADSANDLLAEVAAAEAVEANPEPVAEAIEEAAEEVIEDATEETSDDADPVKAIMAEQTEAVEAPAEETLDQDETLDDNALSDIVAEQESATNTDEIVTEASNVNEMAANTEADIDAIASAFEEATAEINEVTDTITEAVGIDDTSDVAPSANRPLMAPTSSSNSLRDDLQDTRTTLQAALNNISGLLDRLDDQHRETEARLSRATAFQEAAKQSYEASQEFGQAQIELGEARANYDKAQAHIEIARQQWETAQQAGTKAEAAVNTDATAQPHVETGATNDWDTASTTTLPESTCRIPSP